MDDKQLSQKIQAVRLFSVHRNHAEVHRQLVSEHGDNAISVRTIARVNNQFDELGHVLKKDIPGRPRSARSEENENKILQQIHDNGRTPMSSRRLSSVTGISRSTVLRLLHDMKVKPYIPRLIHELSEDDFDRRLETCDTLLQKLADDPNFVDNIIWSDESKFTLDGYVNRHNCVIWSSDNPRFTVDHAFNSKGVMVWAGLSSRGIIGPVFFGENENVNSVNYLHLLEDNVFPLNDGTKWFMQDGAPAHYAVTVRNALDHHFSERWIGRRGPIEWSPRSPDLTPCDFFLWGYMKDKVYAKCPKTINQLKSYISAEMASISTDLCETVCRSVPHRLRECIANEGKQFEYLR